MQGHAEQRRCWTGGAAWGARAASLRAWQRRPPPRTPRSSHLTRWEPHRRRGGERAALPGPLGGQVEGSQTSSEAAATAAPNPPGATLHAQRPGPQDGDDDGAREALKEKAATRDILDRTNARAQVWPAAAGALGAAGATALAGRSAAARAVPSCLRVSFLSHCTAAPCVCFEPRPWPHPHAPARVPPRNTIKQVHYALASKLAEKIGGVQRELMDLLTPSGGAGAGAAAGAAPGPGPAPAAAAASAAPPAYESSSYASSSGGGRMGGSSFAETYVPRRPAWEASIEAARERIREAEAAAREAGAAANAQGRAAAARARESVEEARARLRQQSFEDVDAARARLRSKASESIEEARARIKAEDDRVLAKVGPPPLPSDWSRPREVTGRGRARCSPGIKSTANARRPAC
jgi:hypothetical protein